MARFAVLIAVAVVAAFLLWPDAAREPRPRPAVAPPAEPSGPLARGIERSRAIITVRRGERAWELRGGFDLSEGYRFRGLITRGGYSWLKNGTPIWLAGDGATGDPRWPRDYQTMTKSALGPGRPIWFDDHAPTLPLTDSRFDANGAEVYAHLSLLAIRHGVHGDPLDFARFVRRPPGYSELRKAGLAAGETELDTTVAADRLQRLRLELAPASIDVRLFPSDRPIPALKTRRFAIE